MPSGRAGRRCRSAAHRDDQAGLLEHLTAHGLGVGLVALHPPAGQRPLPGCRWIEPTHHQQAVLVVVHDRPDDGTRCIRPCCSLRSTSFNRLGSKSEKACSCSARLIACAGPGLTGLLVGEERRGGRQERYRRMSRPYRCARCGGPVREPGIWSNAWRCERDGDVDPVAPAVLPSHEQTGRRGARGRVPFWLPWPLPRDGWPPAHRAGDERTGTRAALLSCGGPNPLGGYSELV